MILLKLKYSVQLLFLTYLFLVCICSPDSIITYLHIFPSLSYSLMFMTSWWLSYSYRFFLLFAVRYALSLMSYSYNLKNPRQFCILHQILWDNGTKLLKAKKLGLSWENHDKWDPEWKSKMLKGYFLSLHTCIICNGEFNAQDYECSHSKGLLL